MEIFLDNMDALVFTVFGAILQELLHWYGLRNNLSEKNYSQLLTSISYWVITGLVIIITPVAVVIWFSGKVDVLSPGDFLILGAAFPTLFKSIVARVSEQGEVRLGADTSPDTWNEDRDEPASKMALYLQGR